MAGLAIGADEKKKLYLLGGLFAALAVVGVVVYLPRGAGKTTTPVATPTPAAIAKAPGAPDAAGAAATPAKAGAAPGAISAASLVSVQSFRNDPFEPFPRPPLPVLQPSKTPSGGSTPSVAPPPVVLAPPDQFGGFPPGSDSDGGDFSGGGLPPMGGFSGGSSVSPSSSRALIDLRPIELPTRPNIPTTPGPPGGQSSSGLSESPNKRVSGVIIGDSVRALLEISDGDVTTARIVQPGDEIDGIRILRIERVTIGGRPVTRVIIRENGEERSVVLKPGPKVAPAGGMGGMGGRGGRP